MDFQGPAAQQCLHMSRLVWSSLDYVSAFSRSRLRLGSRLNLEAVTGGFVQYYF